MTPCWMRQVLWVAARPPPNIQEPKMGSPASIQHQPIQAGEPDEVSGQALAFWTTSLETGDRQSLQKRKTPGAHSFVKSLKCAPQRREGRATPGPKGQLSEAKAPPLSIPVTKMNMEKIITFKTYLILEHIISTCRKRMLSDGIFPISLIKLLS